MKTHRITAALCGLGLSLPLACVGNLSAQSPAADYTALRAAFDTPPPAAQMRCYWWWLNGHTDKPTITRDLEEMKAKGFGGALLVDADGSGQGGNAEVTPGPTFGSPAWVDLYTHALREADRLGLEITLNINSGWNLGGPAVTPEESSKVLTWSRTASSGGTLSLALETPPSKNGFYRQITVLAYPLHAGPREVTQPRIVALRSAAVEGGFSMPDSDWMLHPGGSPGGGTGLSNLTANDRKLAGPGGQATKPPSTPAVTDASLSEVRDLSASVDAAGTLRATLPPGQWEILRVGYTDSDARVSTSSGAWQGRALDHMSRTAFDSYWDRVVEPLLAAGKPYRSLRYLATDSWELGGTNWTEGFREEFLKRRGYDPLPWLPAVSGRILDDPEATTRFLADLRRTVADLIVANHFDRFAERAAAHGLGVQAESGGPHGAPLDALETFRHSAVPQTEFWSENGHRSRDPERFFTKEAASAANIYGQRFVAQEGETSIGPQWTESLARDLKPSFDMAVTEGMNRIVWHAFVSSPADTGLPGIQYFAGTHLNPKVTWWDAGSAFFTYMNRVDAMMQAGVAIDDVLYFPGDNVPSFVRLKAEDPARLGPGYDYDVTDEDALLRTIRLDGHDLAGPSGVHWHALAMPRSGRLSLASLERIATLVRGGATVFGRAPDSATGKVSEVDAARFAALTRELWPAGCSAGPRPVGKGRVLCEEDGRAALTAMRMAPDVELPAEPGAMAAHYGATLDYVHRRAGATDVYFLRSGLSQAAQHSVTFRAHAPSVELWNPVTGERHRAGAISLADGRTQVRLELPAFGSSFVVFGSMDEALKPLPSTTRTAEVEPLQPWTLSFPRDHGAPDGTFTLHRFTSWTDSPTPGVRYFSGTATYTADVSAPDAAVGSRVSLRFQQLHELARVRINGRDAGTVWAEPLELRVDPWLKPGPNHIEIEVTNLWPNRLIGDLQPGVTPITSTNIRSFRPDSPLLPSGIVGPVEWVIAQP